MNKFQLFFDNVRSNRVFESIVILVIVFSAVMVGINSYDLDPKLISIILVVDFGITLFFLIELTVRFLGESNKREFFKSGWNIFDTMIVSISLIPIDESELVFLGRLIRIFRVLRMISIIPELRLLVNSLLRALPQLGYVALLMFIIFYIYAAIGNSLFQEIDPTLWGNIAISLLTLFRVMTFEDWTDVMYATQAVYWWSWVYYLSFIFLTAFAFLNMIIGIVVKVLEEEHRAEEAAAKESEFGGPEPTLYGIKQQLDELRDLLNKKIVS
jgi:voltage-gated sodium channel